MPIKFIKPGPQRAGFFVTQGYVNGRRAIKLPSFLAKQQGIGMMSPTEADAAVLSADGRQFMTRAGSF
ncbi:MAG TPA: hypothetical protein VN229_23280 [Terriglobales bacterium]|nr:hypothetical protein [Terriglobales bacterium]